jgi:hypothetical protein
MSDPMQDRIVVEQENSRLGNPFIIAGILAFACLIGYLIYHKRTKL